MINFKGSNCQSQRNGTEKKINIYAIKSEAKK